MNYANSMSRVFALSVVGASALVFYAALFTCLWSLRSPRARNEQPTRANGKGASFRRVSRGETAQSLTSGAKKWTPFTCISKSWRSPRSPGFAATSSRRSSRSRSQAAKSRSSSLVRDGFARRGDRDGYIAIDRLWRNECLRAAREQRAWLAYPADVHMLRRVARSRGTRRPRGLSDAEEAQRQPMTLAERKQARFVPLDVDARDDHEHRQAHAHRARCVRRVQSPRRSCCAGSRCRPRAACRWAHSCERCAKTRDDGFHGDADANGSRLNGVRCEPTIAQRRPRASRWFLTLVPAGLRLSRSFGARARVLSRAVKREAGRVFFARSNGRQPALPPQR